MQITLTNSRTRQKQAFQPLDPQEVRMYACGPTVYNRPHLGNARSAVVYDVLYRLLRQCFAKVTYVCNITDVDDKIIAAAKEQQTSIAQITEQTTSFYHQDMAALNCLSPTHEPRATDHIGEMIEMITALINNKHAYVAEGHVLFAVESYAEYGKLAGRNVEEMIAGSRVEVAPFKRNPMDFVLWKPAASGEEDASFASPWGHGRPGWHIECSAMAKKYLGTEFDIHGGGADLIFPHHENEVAQSCCANNSKILANFWVHNGFLTVGGEKMSKSLGNFKTVHDILTQGVSGWVVRFFYLTAHYRKPLDLNNESFANAQKAQTKFIHALADFDRTQPLERNEELLSILADDLNTAKFIAKLYELAADKASQKRLWFGLHLLGLENLPIAEDDIIIPPVIDALAQQRQAAKAAKNWQEADQLRQKILEAGFALQDMPENQYKITILPQHDGSKN